MKIMINYNIKHTELIPLDLDVLVKNDLNKYGSINVIAHRAEILGYLMQQDFKEKIKDFIIVSDDMYNDSNFYQDRCDISKVYESVCLPVMAAVEEFYDNRLEYEYVDESN